MKNNTILNFKVSERKILLRLFDVAVVLLALYIVGCTFELDYLIKSIETIKPVLVLSLYLNFFGTIFEIYNLQVASNQYKVVRNSVLTATITVLGYLFTPYFSANLPNNRIQIIVFFFTVLLALILWRVFYVNYLASNRFYKKAILVCSSNQILELAKHLQETDPHYKIVAYIDTSEIKDSQGLIPSITIDDLETFILNNKGIEIVVDSQINNAVTVVLYKKLLKLLASGITIRAYEQVYEDKNFRIPLHYIDRDFYNFFPFNSKNNNQLYLILVRFFEVFISIIGLFVAVLMIPFLLLLNSIGNKGPFFYKQKRVGLHGKVFEIIKFRTMIFNAEKNGAVFSIQNDSRITPFGKLMRKTRIDEIPQFWNILKGEMALIGPRPERPFFVDQLNQKMPFYDTRHSIKPGLTGWAQVNYSYGESLEGSLIKLQYDLYYIKHRNLFLDINIAIKTISTVLFYRGQ